MQRCPYLHEMKERLLSQPTPTDSLDMERLDGTPVKEPNLRNDYPAHTNPGVIPEPPEMPPDSLIGTVVKVRLRIPARTFVFPARTTGECVATPSRVAPPRRRFSLLFKTANAMQLKRRSAHIGARDATKVAFVAKT